MNSCARASVPRCLWLPICLVLVLPFFSACDDDATGPDGNPVLRGRVVGPDGQPRSEIVLSPLYFFDPPVVQGQFGFDSIAQRVVAKKLTTQIRFALAETGSTTVTVENALGETIRTLVAAVLDAGDHAVSWASDRDDGTLVPNGLYTFVLEQEGEGEGEPLVARNEFFLLDVDVSSLAKRPLAVTDADGRFSVPMALIPVGHELIGTDEQGNPVAYRVLPRFRLYAFRLEGETIVGQRATEVEVLDPNRSKTLILTVP